MIRILGRFLLFLGVVAAIAGVAYAINGATQARAYVEVAVQVRDGGDLEVAGTSPDGTETTVSVLPEPEFDRGGISLSIPGATRGGSLLAPTDSLELSSFGSTVPEQLLGRGHLAVRGLCLLAGALLIRRLLESINEGKPFQRGNAARIAGITALVVTGALAGLLPVLASNLVLDRIGLNGVDSPVLAAAADAPFSSLMIAALLLALAEAFRRGTDMAQDVEGLV